MWQGWPVDFGDVALPLFDFDKVAELPGKLFCNVEVILLVLAVDEGAFKDLIKDPFIQYLICALYEAKNVGAVGEFDAVFIAALDVFPAVDVNGFDNLGFAILGLNDDLLARRLQVHVDNPRSIAEVEDFVLVVHYPVNGKAWQ